MEPTQNLAASWQLFALAMGPHLQEEAPARLAGAAFYCGAHAVFATITAACCQANGGRGVDMAAVERIAGELNQYRRAVSGRVADLAQLITDTDRARVDATVAVMAHLIETEAARLVRALPCMPTPAMESAAP